jgi:hypothetical protein
MIKYVSSLSLIFLTIGLVQGPQSSAAPSSSPDPCAVALNKDLIVSVRTQSQQYSYLSIIDKETYQELKRNGGLAATIPIVDALVKASANYDDFSKKREAFFQEQRYNSDIREAEQYLSIQTNPIAYKYWSACTLEYARQNVGFYVWKEQEDRQTVTISYYFHSPSGTQTSWNTYSQLTGGKVEGCPNGQVFPRGKKLTANAGGTIIIQRINNQPLVAVLGPEGYSAKPIVSSWSDVAESVVGRVTVSVTTNASVPRLIGTRSTSAVSEDRHNQRCPGGNAPCSPDRKWSASGVPLAISVAAPHFLQEAHVTCNGIPDQVAAARDDLRKSMSAIHRSLAEKIDKEWASVCAYTWGIGSVVITPNSQNVAVTPYSYTRPTKFTLQANEYEPAARQVTTENAFSIQQGKTFTFRVPKDSTARLRVMLDSGETELAAGGSSPDNSIKFVSMVDVGDGYIAYNYEFARLTRREHLLVKPSSKIIPGLESSKLRWVDAGQ